MKYQELKIQIQEMRDRTTEQVITPYTDIVWLSERALEMIAEIKSHKKEYWSYVDERHRELMEYAQRVDSQREKIESLTENENARSIG